MSAELCGDPLAAHSFLQIPNWIEERLLERMEGEEKENEQWLESREGAEVGRKGRGG